MSLTLFAAAAASGSRPSVFNNFLLAYSTSTLVNHETHVGRAQEDHQQIHLMSVIGYIQLQKIQKAAASVAGPGRESAPDLAAAPVAIGELAGQITLVVVTEIETGEKLAFAVVFAFQIMSTPLVSPTDFHE